MIYHDAPHDLPQVAPYLDPLDASLVKEVLRMLRNVAFQGRAALLGAVGRCHPESQRPQGLVASGPSALLPLLQHLVGAAPAPPTSKGEGVIACLHSKDWQVSGTAFFSSHLSTISQGGLCAQARSCLLRLGRWGQWPCWPVTERANATAPCTAALVCCTPCVLTKSPLASPRGWRACAWAARVCCAGATGRGRQPEGHLHGSGPSR